MNGDPNSPQTALGVISQISTVERLKVERQQIEKRLADLVEAEQILADNPQIERLLTIIGGRIY